MGETKLRILKDIDVSRIHEKTLKDAFVNLEVPGWLASVGGTESVGKGKRPEYGRWSISYGAPSEREAIQRLKFVDEWDLAEVRTKVYDLTSGLESVKSELRECKEGIDAILNRLDGLKEKPVTKQIELLEIDETLEVIRPIWVVLEEYEDEVIASFPEIEAFGVGLCEAEAIMNLKDKVKEIFFELEETNDDELGKLPLGWKRILLKVVKRVGNSR